MPIRKPTLKRAAATIADHDLVDRIFEFLRDDPRLPIMDVDTLGALKADLRAEFGGQRCYIPGLTAAESAAQRQERIEAVLRLFNGRNATEIARVLRIGRATVYRILKQAGRPQGTPFRVTPADRLTFVGRETAASLPSDDA